MAHKTKKNKAKIQHNICCIPLYTQTRHDPPKKTEAKTIEHRFHAEIATDITTWNSERKDT